MTTITITNPAADGDPFPNTITGTYTDCPGLPTISVEIKNQGTGFQQVVMTVGVPDQPGSQDGTWSVPKPFNLPAGAYTITATLGTATDTKINIQN